MKILLFAILIIPVMVIPAYAETFVLKGTSDQDRADYLYIEFINGTKLDIGNAHIIHNDINYNLSESFVKFYKNDRFMLKNQDIKMYGIPINTLAELEYDLLVLIKESKEKIKFHTAVIPIPEENIIKPEKDPWEGWKELQEITGPNHVETQKRLEVKKLELQIEQKRLEEIKQRSESRDMYIPSVNKEINILVDSDRRLAYYQTFDFDLRIVDPSINKYNSYVEHAGYIDGVEITSTIKDPTGKTLNQFIGNTTNKGTFSSNNSTEFTYQTFINDGMYTLNILATKYFDDDSTYATSFLSKEFSVYAPNTDTATTFGAPTLDEANGGNGQVELKWTANTDTGGTPLTNYIVEYKLTTSNTWTTFNNAVPTTTPLKIIVTELINGSTYDFQVIAKNSVDQSNPSNTKTAKPATVNSS